MFGSLICHRDSSFIDDVLQKKDKGKNIIWDEVNRFMNYQLWSWSTFYLYIRVARNISFIDLVSFRVADASHLYFWLVCCTPIFQAPRAPVRDLSTRSLVTLYSIFRSYEPPGTHASHPFLLVLPCARLMDQRGHSTVAALVADFGGSRTLARRIRRTGRSSICTSRVLCARHLGHHLNQAISRAGG